MVAIKNKNLGRLWCPKFQVPSAHQMVKDLTRSMRIPNMCLVLKLDYEKVVSIANEKTDRQNHRITPTFSTVL